MKTLKKSAVFCLGIIAVFFLIREIKIVYGKYYAAHHNKGIAVASNVYFSSDKLVKIGKYMDGSIATWDTDITWVRDNMADKIMTFTNTDRWSNGYYDFDILLENYDSNILYNETGMDVGYKIQFTLLDDEVGVTYSVVDYDDNGALYELNYDPVSGGNIVELTGMLEGGTLRIHRYKVRMNLTTSNIKDYKPSRVLVTAFPNSPDYMKKDTNQQYLLTGIFAGTASDMKISIASQNFKVVEDHKSDFDSKHVSYINDLSGYIYNVKTEGDVITNSSTAIKQEIVVKWKSDYLRISEFDEYYDKNRITTGVEDGENYTYLKLDVLPYTSINLTFYKTEKFVEEMKSGGSIYSNSNNFKSLVLAYVEENS